MNGLRSFGDTVWYSSTQALAQFIAFLPALVGALLILIVGWIISGFLAGLLERGLRVLGLERAVERSGLGDFTRQAAPGWTATRIIAELIKWFVRLIFVQAAASVLGIPQLTTIINSIILFIPNILVALLIVVIGVMLANLAAGLVRGAVANLGVANPNTLASLTRYAVIVFAVIAAVDQLNIADNVVNTLFIALVGMIALAVGLAFGLGGREVAAQIAQSWYEGGKTMAAQARQRVNDRQSEYQPAYGVERGTTVRYDLPRPEPRMGD